MGQGPSADIPSSLSQLIDTVKALQLTRSQGLPPVPAGYGTQLDGAQYPNWSKICTQASVQRMSPKKSHEVSVMTAHILYQLRTSPTLKGAHYVVDIGAGQVNIFSFTTHFPPSEGLLGSSFVEPTGFGYACLGSGLIRYSSEWS